MLRLPVILAATCALLLTGAAFGADPTGFFAQIPGAGGCITDQSKTGCADGRGLDGAEAVVLSPDGRFAYTYGYVDGAVATFGRDGATGALSQAPDASACIAPTSLDGSCTDGRLPAGASDSAHAIALSGGRLYMAGSAEDMIAAFARDGGTGALTEPAGQGACISRTGADADGTAGACATAANLDNPNAVAVSPDGRFLYAAGFGTVGLTAYSISDTGVLTPLAGAGHCYATTVVAGCTQSRLATSIYDVAVSPDGGTLYAANLTPGAVVAFRRDPGTGTLTQISGPGGCVVDNGVADPADPCTSGRGLQGPQSVEVSPDGKLVSVGAAGESSVAILRRAPDGSLSQAAGAAGCVAEAGADGCAVSRSTQNVYGTVFGPDSGTLIAAGYGNNQNGSGIAVLDLAADGTPTQRAGRRGCISHDGADSAGTAGSCTAARGVWGPVGLAMTADGTWLYTTGYRDDGLAGFRLRHPAACSDATAATAFGTPVTVAVSCSDTGALAGVDGPANGSVTFDGLSVTYTPAAGFSGTDSFRVKGTDDGAGDSAPATVSVTVGAPPPPQGQTPTPPPVITPARVAPGKLSLAAKPGRDRKLPYRFRFSGRLKPAAGAACSGKVVLQLKRGKKTVARKKVSLAADCRWKAVVKLADHRLLARRGGSLKAKARYAGNDAMTGKRSRPVRVRYGGP